MRDFTFGFEIITILLGEDKLELRLEVLFLFDLHELGEAHFIGLLFYAFEVDVSEMIEALHFHLALCLFGRVSKYPLICHNLSRAFPLPQIIVVLATLFRPLFNDLARMGNSFFEL